MVIVAVLASIILSQEEYNEVTIINKILIALGAAIVSSLLGYILLKPDIDKVDPKPQTNQTNTGNKKKGTSLDRSDQHARKCNTTTTGILWV